MFRSIFIPVAVLLSIAPPAYGQNLPPTYHWPRDRESWHAEQRRLNGNLVMLFPELKDSFELMKSRLASLTDDTQVCDAARGAAFVNELYTDYGDPVMNGENQGNVLSYLADVSNWPAERLTPEGRAAMAAGLMAYVRQGGGQIGIAAQVDVSRALSRLAPENPEALDLALELANDAAEWVEAVDAGPVFREFVQKNLEQMPGEDVWLQLYERTSGVSPKAPPQRYRDALKALADVLEKNAPPDELERRLRKAGKAATADCGDAELNGDLLCRLLIVYRCVLQRRPPVAKSCAEFIDWDLVRLARGDVKSATQWDLWSQAAVKLGPERFSERMRDCVRELVAQKAPPAEQRAALTRLATLTSRPQDQKRR